MTDFEQAALHRLGGNKLGERLGTFGVQRLPRITWSDSGNMMAFVNRRFGVEITDIRTASSVKLEGTGAAGGVAFFPRSQKLAVVSSRHLTIWNADPPVVVNRVNISLESGKAASGFTLGVSPDGRWVAWGTEGPTCRILDTETMELAALVMDGSTGLITDLEWLSPDILAIASFSGVGSGTHPSAGIRGFSRRGTVFSGCPTRQRSIASRPGQEALMSPGRFRTGDSWSKSRMPPKRRSAAGTCLPLRRLTCSSASTVPS